MKPSDPDRAILQAASRKVGLYLASVFAGVVLVVIVAAVVFVAQRSQPSEVIEHAVKPGNIYVGSNDLLVALVGGGILGVILAAVVGLVSARQAIKPLAEALAGQRRFVQDASHELRTPLAILDARLQLAQRQAGSESPAAPALARARKDSAAVAELVNDMLLFSTSAPASDEVTGVGEVVAEVIDDLQDVARAADVALRLHRRAEPGVRMGGATLRRVVMALVENALAHTPPGGEVGVTVATADRMALISVTDDGAGITGIEPARVFDRFAQGQAPDGRGVRGYGIGLALVKEAAVKCGGDVRVIATGGSGTTIAVSLPLAG